MFLLPTCMEYQLLLLALTTPLTTIHMPKSPKTWLWEEAIWSHGHKVRRRLLPPAPYANERHHLVMAFSPQKIRRGAARWGNRREYPLDLIHRMKGVRHLVQSCVSNMIVESCTLSSYDFCEHFMGVETPPHYALQSVGLQPTSIDLPFLSILESDEDPAILSPDWSQPPQRSHTLTKPRNPNRATQIRAAANSVQSLLVDPLLGLTSSICTAFQ
ncbi:hypothetical protein GQ43DRAFT_36957 [Delitschia confertaspora ATCC 74209]|uniref:Uncharacterized protein n=1 Tax=Delitschia confertaspora ATCC 74209 TaxID=1513339 RepID=A0A9P4MQ62_9PLEO|nr:hypothetical protein GQ43DRAFT_36957 [Delitschia confertaspora ATCC 74209]